MLGIRTGALRGLRWGVFGIASVALVALSNNSSLAAPYADIVLDANSGKVLHSSNPDAKRHPASLTKIMTLYLLFEQLEAGEMTLDEKMDVSEEAAAQSPTKLGLRAGSTISVEDALKGLITRSANDAAVVIAEWIGDDEESFAKLMTQKAKALGMTRTVYKNASGLPDDEQVTTARDQAILGRAIQEHFPRYYKYFSTRSFRYNGRAIRNHNSLLGRVEGVDGIKTGYIRASGFNLVTSVHRGNRYVVAVVMGGQSARSRDARMRQLIADNLGRAASKRTVANIPRPVEPAETSEDSETEVAANTEARPEEKVVANREPKPAREAVAKPEPKAEPAVAVKSEPNSEAKDQHRFNIASAGSALVRAAPRPEPSSTATIPPVGATDPIRPVPVKTVTVRSAVAARTAPLAPLNASVTPAPQARPAAAPAPVRTAKAEAPPSPPEPRPNAQAAKPPQKTTAASAPEPAAAPKQREPAAAAPAKPVRSGWMIQVGAFKTDDDAKERLSAVQSKAAKVVAGTDPFTETVEKGGSTYYRARFAGFDRDTAEAACKFLKRNDVECMPVRN
jgi:D-alanyl-D-alanine carboxypeptidase